MDLAQFMIVRSPAGSVANDLGNRSTQQRRKNWSSGCARRRRSGCPPTLPATSWSRSCFASSPIPTDDWYIEAFNRNTVMPGASDLIFYPQPAMREATAEEIVDDVMAYRPIAL